MAINATDLLIKRTRQVSSISESLPRLSELQCIRDELVSSISYERFTMHQAHPMYSRSQPSILPRRMRLVLLFLAPALLVFLLWMILKK